MNAIFAGVGWTDTAVVGNSTASGTNAEPDQLLTDRRSEFWRTAANENFAFANIDLGVTRPITTVALFDVFGPTDIDLRVSIRLAATEAELTSGPFFEPLNDVDAPVLADGSRQIMHSNLMDGTPQRNERWVRVQIAHFGTATQPLGASRLIVAGPGSQYTPDCGVAVGSDVVTPTSRSDVTETDSGSVFVRHLYTRRIASPQLRMQKDASYLDPSGLWDLLAFAGSNRPILFAQEADLDYTASAANAERVSKQMLYGRLPNPDGIRAESANHRSITLDMEEWT